MPGLVRSCYIILHYVILYFIYLIYFTANTFHTISLRSHRSIHSSRHSFIAPVILSSHYSFIRHKIHSSHHSFIDHIIHSFITQLIHSWHFLFINHNIHYFHHSFIILFIHSLYHSFIHSTPDREQFDLIYLVIYSLMLLIMFPLFALSVSLHSIFVDRVLWRSVK